MLGFEMSENIERRGGVGKVLEAGRIFGLCGEMAFVGWWMKVNESECSNTIRP